MTVMLCSGNAATYYVDFDGGSDAAAGTATTTAWQHCPGDDNATGNAAISLSAGDAVLFKGGVIYRGVIAAEWNGTPAAPIILKGNGWGEGKAIISGSEVIGTSWTQCTNSADARGNPAYTNIWFTATPAGTPYYTTLSKGTAQYYLAQDPNPSDFMAWQELTEYRAGYESNVTTTAITDVSVFTSEDTNFFAGCYVYVWVTGNAFEAAEITGYSPATRTISFSLSGTVLFQSGVTRWKILNNPAQMDTAGEYSIQTDRVYLYSTTQPADVELARRGKGIYTSSGNNLKIEGFTIRAVCAGQAVAPMYGGSGLAVWNTVTNIWLVDNELYFCNAPIAIQNAIYFHATTKGYAWGNTIHDCFNRGIGLTATHGSILSNTVYRLSGTAISPSGNYTEVAYNVIHDIKGIHANGYSTYGISSPLTGITLHHNLGYAGPRIFTLEYVKDLMVYNNIFDTGGGVQCFADWGNDSGTNRVFNNIIIGTPGNSCAIAGGNGSGVLWLFANNIVDGFSHLSSPSSWNTVATSIARSNNVYVGYSWLQAPGYGWALGTGESASSNLAHFFVNRAARDYRLPVGSPAVGAGAVLNLIFTDDYAGTTRGTIWDIGAYEYESPPPDPGAHFDTVFIGNLILN